MAAKANPTPLEIEEQRRNETVDFLQSCLLAGGNIQRKAQLDLNFRRWLTTIKQHGEVPSRVPAFLFGVLIHFTTAKKAEDIKDIQTPEAFTDLEKWLVKVRALIDEKADERLLCHLSKLPGGKAKVTSQELLSPDLESLDRPPVSVNSTRSEPSAREIRDAIRSGDTERMNQMPEVFYLTGNIAGTVRAPYWHVALATDSQGDRFLSDDVLDRALPRWRLILSGETTPDVAYSKTVESFGAWLAAEQRKASRLGKPWARVQPSTTVEVSASTPKTAGSDKTSSAFRSHPRSGGHACMPSSEKEDPNEVEQTRLLQEILAETKETRKVVQEFLGALQGRGGQL